MSRRTRSDTKETRKQFIPPVTFEKKNEELEFKYDYFTKKEVLVGVK